MQIKRHSRGDQDTLTEALRGAFDRAGVLAAEQGATFPLAIRLVDANLRCLLRMEIRVAEYGLIGRTEDGDLESRGGVPLPWFLIASDGTGWEVSVRLELDPPSRQN